MQQNTELKAKLAADGKVLTARQREQLAEQQEAAAAIVRQQFEGNRPEIEQEDVSGLDALLVRIPSVVNAIHDMGNTLTTIAQAIIPSLLPFLLIALIFAEAERVRHGVELFERYRYLSYIVAYILVLGNAFLELAIQHKRERSGFEEDNRYEFSLRIWAGRLAYLVGIGNEWEPRPKSPAIGLERLQRGLTAAILFLAVSGSMKATIEQQTGNWRAGLVSIAVDSTLLELMVWLSGLVSAVVIVLLAQKIVAYSYQRAAEYYHELVERGDRRGDTSKLDQWNQERAAAVESARAQVEREILIRELTKRDVSLNGVVSGKVSEGEPASETV